jgi:polysaccharide pyruvyl transferase WcaK-like protein
MNICLSGYYFVGSRGDEVLRKIIIRDLSQFGKVKVICCESRNFEKVIDWCDVFVLGGGTLINARGIGGYEQVKYAKQKGKKVMLYANTIEDGDPKFHEFMKYADAITVRDSESHLLCISRGYQCTLAADPAIKAFNKKRIHVGLRNWVIEPEHFVERIAGVLDKLANKYILVFTPYTLKHTDTISDIQFSRRVREKMQTKIKIKNFKENARPDLFIGMRLHSIIATIKQTIPTIAINYDGKIGNFMRDIGKEEFLVEYETIEKIAEIVSKLFLEELIEREKKNIEVFRALVKR